MNSPTAAPRSWLRFKKQVAKNETLKPYKGQYAPRLFWPRRLVSKRAMNHITHGDDAPGYTRLTLTNKIASLIGIPYRVSQRWKKAKQKDIIKILQDVYNNGRRDIYQIGNNYYAVPQNNNKDFIIKFKIKDQIPSNLQMFNKTEKLIDYISQSSTRPSSRPSSTRPLSRPSSNSRSFSVVSTRSSSRTPSKSGSFSVVSRSAPLNEVSPNGLTRRPASAPARVGRQKELLIPVSAVSGRRSNNFTRSKSENLPSRPASAVSGRSSNTFTRSQQEVYEKLRRSIFNIKNENPAKRSLINEQLKQVAKTRETQGKIKILANLERKLAQPKRQGLGQWIGRILGGQRKQEQEFMNLETKILEREINNLLRNIETNIQQNKMKTQNEQHKSIQNLNAQKEAYKKTKQLKPEHTRKSSLLQLKNTLCRQLRGKATSKQSRCVGNPSQASVGSAAGRSSRSNHGQISSRHGSAAGRRSYSSVKSMAGGVLNGRNRVGSAAGTPAAVNQKSSKHSSVGSVSSNISSTWSNHNNSSSAEGGRSVGRAAGRQTPEFMRTPKGRLRLSPISSRPPGSTRGNSKKVSAPRTPTPSRPSNFDTTHPSTPAHSGAKPQPPTSEPMGSTPSRIMSPPRSASGNIASGLKPEQAANSPGSPRGVTPKGSSLRPRTPRASEHFNSPARSNTGPRTNAGQGTVRSVNTNILPPPAKPAWGPQGSQGSARSSVSVSTQPGTPSLDSNTPHWANPRKGEQQGGKARKGSYISYRTPSSPSS